MVCVPPGVKAKGPCIILLVHSTRKRESASQRRNNGYCPENCFEETLLIAEKQNLKHSFTGHWRPGAHLPELSEGGTTSSVWKNSCRFEVATDATLKVLEEMLQNDSFIPRKRW